MAIEKMSLVNIVGNINDVDKTLANCLKSGYFHPEDFRSSNTADLFKPLEGENQYTAYLNKLVSIGTKLKISYQKQDFDCLKSDFNQVFEYIDTQLEKVKSLHKKKTDIKSSIDEYKKAIHLIARLKGLEVRFDDIFACKYVKVRFGRLPYDSYVKLNYYDSKPFFFFSFDHNDEYVWGVYFAPATKIALVEDAFNSLFFERLRVPDYAKEKPEQAIKHIESLLKEKQLELEQVNNELKEIKKAEQAKLNEYFCVLKCTDTTFGLRKNVAVLQDNFYLVGFIPKRKEKEFEELFKNIKSVSCVSKPHDANPSFSAPIKLKNNKFVKPFEMFTNMYSLPSYKDMDLTPLVAISYTLLFGIMFGDLGQGLVFAIIGMFLAKKGDFGKILIRIGLSSAVFGVLYGSVFGYEDWLDPLYKNLFNLSSKPIHVFDSDTGNLLLGGAVFIGVVLISLSIIINITQGLKTKDYERAIFGHNGIAGLIFYISTVIGVASMMLNGPKLFTAPYIIFLIVVPLLVIFFRGPLTKLAKGQKDFMPKSFGEFVTENFFELFEYVLSFLSNSMSFLRVGGFILSHAGMMAVVMLLAEMTSKAASPIVIIIGNIFVMGLEGLIVGIQVLRLEFYEIFSRNFIGNGKPFEPAKISFEIEQH